MGTHEDKEEEMAYIIGHTHVGFCWWDPIALIILIAVVAVYVVKIHNMKTDKKELEDALTEYESGAAAGGET